MSNTNTQNPLVRQAWIDACHFHDLSEKEVLALVGERLKKTPKPLVLFDLDSTLYEVGPRTFQILREWQGSAAAGQFPQVVKAIDKLKPQEVGYSLADTFGEAAKLSHEFEAAFKNLKPFWAQRFFTSNYLRYDHAYPRAADFVKIVYQMGAEVVYLTGRDAPGMGDGTKANLLRDGFPWDVPRTHLLLKANSKDPDLDHKVNASHYIKKHGTLIASFENEPANIAALSDVFPEAMHVFVDTVYSDHGAMPRQGLYRIEGW